AAAAADRNLLKDGGFEAQPPVWGQNIQCGKFNFAIDLAQKHGGAASTFLQCTELGAADLQPKFGTRAWARWHQTGLKVDPQTTYRFRAWYRTDANFAGTVKFWVTPSKTGTVQAQALNTQGLWREVKMEGIKPANESLGVYLNLMDGIGSVWFDDVELVEEP
ncbi:MAG: hypothetical protein WCP21_01670, partial [Armatimonadota bacterium]